MMSKSVVIPFETDMNGLIDVKNGDWGLIIAHGEKTDFDSKLFQTLAKKLSEKKISSLRFQFPFRKLEKRVIEDIHELDQAYLAVWEWVNKEYPNIRWALAGLDIGAESAIRISGLATTVDMQIPPVIALNYPLYKPNRPEMVDAASLGAVMGDVIFIQAENYNRGSFTRLRNQLSMMVPHAELKKIRGANSDFEVPEKTQSNVTYWISNDIQRFLQNQP